MKPFFSNIRKYKSYMIYSAVASLKEDVSGSYFNWLWWILDPLFFMLVYTFISLIVFGRSEPHLIPFIFIGYSAWSFINRCVHQSVKLVRSNKSILARMYLPKYVLLVSTVIENFCRYLISIGLCIIIATIDHVEFTWYALWFPVMVGCLIILIFSICTVLLHIGVYMKDLNNIITVILKLLFYMSGIFYNISKRVPEPYNKILLYGNPIAFYLDQMRNVLIYGKGPNLKFVVFWLIISCGIASFGIYLIHRYEQSYVKAI